jgi:hypothetical protein
MDNIYQINETINNTYQEFISKANELVYLSNNMYQIENTIKLNKISLKDYILNSPCCKMLKEKNISNYSISKLKEELTNYELISNEDCTLYHLAILLYELLNKISNLIDTKIDLEIEEISKITPLINEINTINKNMYKNLYNEISTYLNNNYANKWNFYKEILNDIFNYYINGYPNIETKNDN